VACLLADIREHWPHIGPKLGDLATRLNLEWRPEDVYAACVNGDAALYIGTDDDGVMECFSVVRSSFNPFNPAEKKLFIWVAYGLKGELAEKYWPEYFRIANEIGASVIEMHSPRVGFRRKEEWAEKMTIYQRRVPSGKVA